MKIRKITIGDEMTLQPITMFPHLEVARHEPVLLREAEDGVVRLSHTADLSADGVAVDL